MPVAHQNTATRTPLFSRHQPGGTYAYAPIRRFPGEVFFAGSASTNCVDDTGHGRSPEAPFATLDYAIGQTTANQGDVIYLMPGHVELVTAAGDLTLDMAGVHIIGVGNGTIQPIIRFTTINTTDMLVSAANCTVEHVNFQAGVANVAAAIDVNATDFTIRNCRFTEQTAGLNCLIWIQLPGDTTAARLTVEDCFVYAPNAANDSFINFSDTGDGHKVKRNTLHGDWDVAAIGGAGVITNADISDNYIYNLAAISNSCLLFADAATGTMMNNYVGNGQGASDQITATGMAKCYNYGVDLGGADVQGIPEPAMA
jgi:hypothetical protein